MSSTIEGSQARQKIPRQILVPASAKICFRKVFKLGERLRCNPYVWDDDRGYPVFSTSPLRLLGWVFNIIFAVSYFMFLLVQCIGVYLSPVEHISTKALLLFYVIFFGLAVGLQATILMAREQLSDFVRSSFCFCQKFEDNYLSETAQPSRTPTLCEIFIKGMFYAVKLNGSLMTSCSLARLDSPEQISSMIPGYPLVQITVNIVFCSYFYSSFAANCCVLGFPVIGMVFPFLDIAKKLGQTVSSITNARFQHPQDRIRVYRVLQLQANAIDRVYWFAIANAKYALMFIGMFCTYGAIRIPGLVGHLLGVLGVSCTLILVVWMSAFAEFYSSSSKALESLNTMTARPDLLANEKLRAWFRKSVRSLHVARIPVGGMYYIDKELVLNAVEIIINGIIFLLVNF